jgi:hypothetical protein
VIVQDIIMSDQKKEQKKMSEYNKVSRSAPFAFRNFNLFFSHSSFLTHSRDESLTPITNGSYTMYEKRLRSRETINNPALSCPDGDLEELYLYVKQSLVISYVNMVIN